MADMGIAILGLALLYIMGKKNGVIPATAPAYTPWIGGYEYRTPQLLEIAVRFEDYLETHETEIEDFEKKRRLTYRVPPIPVKTKAIAYRAFIQEKPVKRVPGVYQIR